MHNMPSGLMSARHHLHLVSDATGETINAVARACLAQFEGIQPIEHHWTLIRTQKQMHRVISEVEFNPGPVLFTLVNDQLRSMLMERCQSKCIPCISLLDPAIRVLAGYFGVKSIGQPGLQHALDAEYFSRIDAMNFALAHDDGQLTSDINRADVVLVGVSRTSKTPTCVYLANRGIRAANVPVVPGCPLPSSLLSATNPFIVGLTKDPVRLVEIRRNRLRMIAHSSFETDYVNLDTVTEEVAIARKLYSNYGWPIIDVTRKSIEETAATVINFLHSRYT